ncbi:Ig-like domain-containing protein [Psychromicrobium lacuslunae]|uniref:Gram-positive cocci surface proteins LPxTG domain-containing protein n=1 Tax=Psychromicrobium lacuslunae TaxID=1618207 RepID=A0A0D4C0S5_9MICC|nr:Ig-like domain-containing protein [Psychromicrobium lacuslunae]AJT42149.1 hypothetical protein UM93_12700 [Psychromicrobium lacuslunae]
MHKIQVIPGARKRPFYFVALLLAALLAIFGLNVLAQPAQAAEIPGAVTKVTVTPSNPGQYDPITVNASWSVPNGSKPGDTFSLTLPDELVALTSNFDLKDADGQVVATAKVVDGVVVFTLTDYVTTHRNVRGTATFTTQLDQTVTPGEPIELDFGTAGKVTITPAPGTPIDRAKPVKYGNWVDQAGNVSATPTGRIRWVIESPIGPFDTATFTDHQGAGQTLDCSTLSGRTSTGFNTQGEVAGWAPMPAEGVSIEKCTAEGFTVTLSPVPEDKVVSVSYIVAVTDPSLLVYSNSAEVTVNGTTLPVTSEIRRYQSGGDGSGEAIKPTPTTSAPTVPPTVPPTTAPPTTSAPSTTTTSNSSSPAVVQSSSTSPADQGELANTGSAGLLPLLGIAGAAMMAGLALLLIRRRAH